MGVDPTDLDVLKRVAVSAEDMAEQAEAIKLAAVRSEPREVAVERGWLLGEDEARKRGETGQDREDRVKRAMAYAAWEYDGKPTDGSHMREFGVAQQSENLVGLSGPDWKKGKK